MAADSSGGNADEAQSVETTAAAAGEGAAAAAAAPATGGNDPVSAGPDANAPASEGQIKAPGARGSSAGGRVTADELARLKVCIMPVCEKWVC